MGHITYYHIYNRIVLQGYTPGRLDELQEYGSAEYQQAAERQNQIGGGKPARPPDFPFSARAFNGFFRSLLWCVKGIGSVSPQQAVQTDVYNAGVKLLTDRVVSGH